MELLAQRANAAQVSAFIVGLLCSLIVAAVVGTLVGAVILRAACWLYNKFVGGPKSRESVPMPDFGRAMGIAFVVLLVNCGTAFLVESVVGGGAAVMGKKMEVFRSVAQLVATPISFLVLTAMLSGMLPTSLGRAALVALLYVAFSIIVLVVIMVFIVAIVASIAASVPH